MPKKRRSSRQELLSRRIEIQSFNVVARLAAVHNRGEEPYIESGPWLELNGTMTEPIRDTHKVKLSICPREKPQVGSARPASVGAIIRERPDISVVLPWPEADFSRVLTLAAAGLLKYGYVCFTKPRYNSALVVSASLSSEPEE